MHIDPGPLLALKIAAPILALLAAAFTGTGLARDRREARKPSTYADLSGLRQLMFRPSWPGVGALVFSVLAAVAGLLVAVGSPT